jgi:hypothetical protein
MFMLKHTPNPSQEGNQPWPIPLLRGVRGVFLNSKWVLQQELFRSLLDFNTYFIEKWIKEIGKTNQQLVLFIDGLEVLLNYSPEHWNAQFFGSLRTIASLS